MAKYSTPGDMVESPDFIINPPHDPFVLFDIWVKDANATEPRDPNAVQLATVDSRGLPNIRTVLVRQYDRSGFVFFTNMKSAKGNELRVNSKAGMLYYWKSKERQVRLRGDVKPVSNSEADDYFQGRPRASQIGAHASLQSETLPGRAELEARICDSSSKYQGLNVPRPKHWSGFRLIPNALEFWQQRPYRLHDRLLYEKTETGWSWRYLYP